MDCRRCCQWLSGRPNVSGDGEFRGNAELTHAMLPGSRPEDGPVAAVSRTAPKKESVQRDVEFVATKGHATTEGNGNPSHKPASELHPPREHAWNSSADPLLGKVVKQIAAQTSETSVASEQCKTAPINSADGHVTETVSIVKSDVAKTCIDGDIPVPTVKSGIAEAFTDGDTSASTMKTDVAETPIDGDLAASAVKPDVAASTVTPVVAETTSIGKPDVTDVGIDGDSSASTKKPNAAEASTDNDVLASTVKPDAAETPTDDVVTASTAKSDVTETPADVDSTASAVKADVTESLFEGAQTEKPLDDGTKLAPTETEGITTGASEVLQNPAQEAPGDQVPLTATMGAVEAGTSETPTAADQIEKADDEHQRTKLPDEGLSPAATEVKEDFSQVSSGNQVDSEATSTGTAKTKAKAKARKQSNNKKWKSKNDAQNWD